VSGQDGDAPVHLVFGGNLLVVVGVVVVMMVVVFVVLLVVRRVVVKVLVVVTVLDVVETLPQPVKLVSNRAVKPQNAIGAPHAAMFGQSQRGAQQNNSR